MSCALFLRPPFDTILFTCPAFFFKCGVPSSSFSRQDVCDQEEPGMHMPIVARVPPTCALFQAPNPKPVLCRPTLRTVAEAPQVGTAVQTAPHSSSRLALWVQETSPT